MAPKSTSRAKRTSRGKSESKRKSKLFEMVEILAFPVGADAHACLVAATAMYLLFVALMATFLVVALELVLDAAAGSLAMARDCYIVGVASS